MVAQGDAVTSDLMLLSEAQMRRIEPYFPLRVDDRRIMTALSSSFATDYAGARPPKEYGPHKTIYNRFIAGASLVGSVEFWPTSRPDASGSN
jgi:putative transposase